MPRIRASRISAPRIPVRKPVLLVVALSSLLGVAACSSGNAGGTTPAGPVATSADPAVAASADAALSKDSTAICAQASRTATSFGKAFLADLQGQAVAASQGTQAKSEAKAKLAQDVSNYSSALSGMSKLADDAALKKALAAMSKKVDALKGDLSKINATKMATITANLDTACGR
jgi:hypothetical protein